MADQTDYDGAERRVNGDRREENASLGDEARLLVGEVRGLRKDVRVGKVIAVVLGFVVVVQIVLGALGYLAYRADRTQDREDRTASRLALCGVLNDYVIARDEAGVRALLSAAQVTPEQQAEKDKGKTPAQIEKDAADMARRLMLLADLQSMKLVDGTVYAPRINCIAYINDPAHVKFLPVPKPAPTTTTTTTTTAPA